MHIGLVLRHLGMQSRVLLFESLYPFMQLLAPFIILVHLLREVLELFDCLLGLPPQHQTELLSLAGEFLYVLLQSSEAHLFSLGSIMRVILLNVEDLSVELQLHVNLLSFQMIDVPFLFIRGRLQLSHSIFQR